MASSRCVFNAKQFYETLSSTKGIAPQLLALRLNFEKGDIAFIFQGTLALQEVLQSPSELPLTKYNALLALQELLRTAAYPALSLAELLLLPLLAEVTAHQIRARTQDDTDRYFVEKGFRDSIGIRKVGRRYVLLAIDILFGAAAVRPHLNVLHQELADLPSRFGLAAKNLKEKGVQPNEDERKSWQLHRLSYLKHLSQCDTQQYADFVTRRLREDIVYRQGLTPATRKLLESQDPFVTMPACNACVAMLSDLSLLFPHKRHYLSLLSSLVKSGDAYAIVVVHNGSFIKEISEEIAKVRGDQSLTYGKLIYPNVQASLQDKLDFYCEFLRCLETWAVCLPFNEIGEPSEIAALYHYLREQKRFHFPQNSMMRKIQQDFHENLKRRQSQNEEVLRIIEGDSQLLSTCLRLKSSNPSALVKTHPHSHGPHVPSSSNSRPSSNDSFQDLLQEVSDCIGGLGEQKKVHEQMYYLREFQREWPQLRQTCKKEQKVKLVTQGDGLLNRIQNVFPLYVQLQKKAITFEAFRERVQSLLKSSSESSWRDSEQSEKEVKLIEQQKVEQFSAESEERNAPTIQEVSHEQSEGQGELACWSKNSAWLRPAHQETISNDERQISFAPPGKQMEFILNKSSQLLQDQSKKQDSALNFAQVTGRNEQNQFISFQQRMAEIPIQQSQLVTLNCKQNLDNPPSVLDQEIGENEYGIRQLLCKHKKYLKEAKQSSLQSSWSHVLPSSLQLSKAPSTPNSHAGSKITQLPQWIITKRNESPSTKANPTFKSSESKVANVKRQPFQIYQIGKSIRNDTQDLADSRQNMSNRSRNLLERIAYSSTSKAIRAYGEHVSRSSSRSSRDQHHWLSADKSNSRSIIRKQYTKFISRQQEGNMSQGSGGPSFNTSRSHLPSSMPSLPHSHPSEFKDLKRDSIIEAMGSKNNSKLIRCCLKNKGVLYSGPELEVGFVHFRRDLNLDFTIYITAKIAISVLKIEVQSNEALFTRSEVSKLKQLTPGQQESFKIETCPMKTPYQLPKITLTWPNNPPIIIPLPCTFNKYIQMRTLHHERYYRLLPSYNQLQAVHCNFELGRKMAQKQTMLKLLPHFTPWEQNSYLCECIYQRESFLLELVLNEGRARITGRGCSPETLEYLVSTFCFLLAK